jgi:hypothetical protein
MSKKSKHDRLTNEQTRAVRRIKSLIKQIDRMHAATGGRVIRFDVPITEQFDGRTCEAILRAMQ